MNSSLKKPLPKVPPVFRPQTQTLQAKPAAASGRAGPPAFPAVFNPHSKHTFMQLKREPAGPALRHVVVPLPAPRHVPLPRRPLFIVQASQALAIEEPPPIVLTSAAEVVAKLKHELGLWMAIIKLWSETDPKPSEPLVYNTGYNGPGKANAVVDAADLPALKAEWATMTTPALALAATVFGVSFTAPVNTSANKGLQTNKRMEDFLILVSGVGGKSKFNFHIEVSGRKL